MMCLGTSVSASTCGVNDSLVLVRKPGNFNGSRTRGDDNVVRRVFGGASAEATDTVLGPVMVAVLCKVNVVSFQQCLPHRELLDDAALPLLEGSHVHGRFTRHFDAHGLCLSDRLGCFPAVINALDGIQPTLRQTHPNFFLNDECFDTELSEAMAQYPPSPAPMTMA